MKINRLVLASTSPFRRALLERTGLRFTVAAAPVDEDAITGASPEALAAARSEAKALAVSRAEPDALVIGGDQVLGFEGKAYGKVNTPEAASRTLQAFAGKTHTLHSTFSLALDGRVLETVRVDVPMTVRALTASEIAAYVATGEWQDCAGCYRIEGRGIHLFESVGGSDSAIIGLPLVELCAALRRQGVDGLTDAQGPWTR